MPANTLQGEERASYFSQDVEARKAIEGLAMQAVMDAEVALGNSPTDVAAQKLGYDIISYDPDADGFRFIEVKGRVADADTVMITRQELITSLHEPGKFILAIVQVEGREAHSPRYVHGALDTREPPFEQNAIQFSIKHLLNRAEAAK